MEVQCRQQVLPVPDDSAWRGSLSCACEASMNVPTSLGQAGSETLATYRYRHSAHTTRLIDLPPSASPCPLPPPPHTHTFSQHGGSTHRYRPPRRLSANASLLTSHHSPRRRYRFPQGWFRRHGTPTLYLPTRSRPRRLLRRLHRTSPITNTPP